MPIEAFSVQEKLACIPPHVEAIEAVLVSSLPAGSRVLQWAITHADPTTGNIALEGSMETP